jgi:glycosyltransferase involved in cell wall biosynthesis
MMTYANLAGLVASSLPFGPGLPVVISERTVPAIAFSLADRGSNAFTKRLFARMLYRRARQAIAISHPVAADMIAGYRLSPESVQVIPNPVLEEVWLPTEALPSPLVLGFVGRLVPRKGPLLFVETLHELAKRGIHSRGVVFGDGECREVVEARADELDVSVDFRGWVRDWTSNASELHCLLLPSAVEGFANVLVEAGHIGLPAVARSSALGVADALIPGITGELAPGGSPGVLAESVCRTMQTRSANPMDKWRNSFSKKESVRKLIFTLEAAVQD